MSAATTRSDSETVRREAATPHHLRARAGMVARVAAVSAILGLAAGLLWLGISLLGARSIPADSGPIYSLATLQTGLHQEPDEWLHRPLRVRAIAGRCMAFEGGSGSPCLSPQPFLADAGGTVGGGMLPLVYATPSPLVSLVRQTPLLGSWAPRPQTPRWGEPAVYTVELSRLPCGADGTAMCYEAVLADGAAGQ